MSTILYDVLPDTGVFTAINNIKAFPWADVITPTQMDSTYKALYTNKPVSKLVLRVLNGGAELTEDNIKALANILYNMYYEKWVIAYNLFITRETAFAKGYSETIKETTTHDNKTTDTGTTTNEGTELGQISAYNEATMQDKDNQISNSSSTRDLAGTDNGTTVREYERNGFGENYVDAYTKMIADLQNNLLYDIIFTDANSLLALHIYD